jgi:hypothetical protein
MNVPRVRVPMTMSGYCQHPSTPEHTGCRRVSCTCTDCDHNAAWTRVSPGFDTTAEAYEWLSRTADT